ncbi:phosphoribosylanthranilate isomerase [Acidisphaera sp. L21]|uniref:phosphoribosylanthranilate isomerase n=1 Tax=Acidisphaera sp. L21 TaxID=1641851 RepID=UPI00131E04F2|nr:phosphoribosylanthranilate isomerase [Acidisphaera sp. L21]
MPVEVKICGISTPDAYEAAASADYIGFVFFPPSPRYITPARAAGLAVGRARHVGLFVDPTDGQIAEMLDAFNLDILQIVAPVSRAAALRARFGRPVWRAVGIRAAADLPAGLDGADALLLDAKPPAGATRPGGNAVSFDWSILAGWQAPGPWLLAGGLTPGNVADAIVATGALAVDVSSGVESAPGQKDPALIRAFLQAARSVTGRARIPSA